jgi:tRNA modification GTPase
MRRARLELQRADLALVVVDARAPQAAGAELREAVAGVPLQLWVHNKSDLLARVPPDTAEVVHVSAAGGQGLEHLHARLGALAAGAPGAAGEGSGGEFSARARHVEALERALAHASAGKRELDHERLELAAEELHLAHDALGEITGKISADDMLGRIFASFCIGK